ncbi:MAG: hypothetical protein ABSD90_13165 [Methylocystis sp.]|jgi:hypothetical protein
MRTARPENDNLEFGFSSYTDKYGRPYAADAFENDVGHYEGPRSEAHAEFTKELLDRIKKIQAEKSPRA